jgi:hypothetical protein
LRRLALILLMLAALLGPGLVPAISTRPIELHGPYTHESGLAWYAPASPIAPPLPLLFEVATDTSAAPQGTIYALSDAQGPLGPAHALHDDIRRLGGGRYSFWNGRLLFSTRQGDDPNAAGLVLMFSPTARVAAWLRIAFAGLAVAAALLLALDLRRRDVPPRMVLSCLALFIAIFDALSLARLPNAALYSADTDGYYDFYELRTAGYGLLLHAVQSVFGQLYWLALFQFAAAGLAALVLAAAVQRVFRAPVLAVAIAVLLTVKQGPAVAHMTLLPDSLFFSCATVALAAAILTLEAPRPGRLFLLGGTLALAMALRPAAIGLLPGLGLVPLLLWPKNRTAALGLAALLAAGLCANLPAQRFAAALTGRENAGAGKFSGFVLIGSAGFLLTPQTPTDQPVLRDELVGALVPIRAAWLAAQTLDEMRVVLGEDQDRIIYDYAQPIACHPPPMDCTRAAVDEALRRLSIDAIRADPAGMAEEAAVKLLADVTDTLSGDWEVHQEQALAGSRASLAGSRAVKRDLAGQHWDLDARSNSFVPDPLGLGPLLYARRGDVNIVILAAALASFSWFLAALLRCRLGPETGALGVAALGFLAYHIFLCILEVPIFRYAEPLTAWYLLSLGGGLSLALRRFRERTT